MALGEDTDSGTLKIGRQIDYHFNNYPIKMQTHMHKLVTLYFTRIANIMYTFEDQLEYHPLKTSSLFEFTMAHEAVFHGLLYTAGVASSLIEGSTASEEESLQMSKTLALVGGRLNDVKSDVSDGTISAASCLAFAKALRGHLEGLKVHMLGVKRMTQLRGGLASLPTTLRMKLFRVDLTGGVTFVTNPHFEYPQSKKRPTMYSDPHLLEHDLLENEISDFPFKWSLVPVFNETRDFSAKMLWIEKVLADRGKALWDEVEIMRGVLSG
ncbi:hypothetical protein OEA41_004715 [Lepraria neglecta]|uniref:Uncharacterized protein n=1 Tax=Lepraria neglecta TaxID=209136 RepID=A0AAD9YY43_9LECA|nr:hypothetical protein OEA41_004715 [Lepraria neglecta]